VGPGGAIAIGIGGAAICYAAVTLLKPAMGYDDSLDVFGVHGVGGTWGALATGLFIADFAAADGVSRGAQFLKQLASVGFTAVFACAVTFVILVLLKVVFGDLRVQPDDESMGLDQAEHSESAYT
jgi:Amt family ammonium transporter